MAAVRLTADQCRRDKLPPLCARCGRPTPARVDRTFTWHPPWVGAFLLAGILPGVVLMLYLIRRMRVKLPLCDRHRTHWSNPRRFLWVALPVCVALIAVGVVLRHRDAGNLGTLGMWAFIGCLAANGVWQARLIRADRIGEDEIVLTGVCLEFAEAAKDLRDRDRVERDYGEYDDEEVRPRRRSRYDVDE